MVEMPMSEDDCCGRRIAADQLTRRALDRFGIAAEARIHENPGVRFPDDEEIHHHGAQENDSVRNLSRSHVFASSCLHVGLQAPYLEDGPTSNGAAGGTRG